MNGKFEKAVATSVLKEYGVLGIVGSSKEPTYFGQAKEGKNSKLKSQDFAPKTTPCVQRWT